jgi:hypothetical protein
MAIGALVAIGSQYPTISRGVKPRDQAWKPIASRKLMREVATRTLSASLRRSRRRSVSPPVIGRIGLPGPRRELFRKIIAEAELIVEIKSFIHCISQPALLALANALASPPDELPARARTPTPRT